MRKTGYSPLEYNELVAFKKANPDLFDKLYKDIKLRNNYLTSLRINYLNGSLEQEEIDVFNYLFDANENADTLAKTTLKDVGNYLRDYCVDMDYERLPIIKGQRMLAVKRSYYNTDFYPTPNDYVFAYDNTNVTLTWIELSGVITQQQARDLNELMGRRYYVIPKVYAEKIGYKKVKDKKNLLAHLPKIQIIKIYQRAQERLKRLKSYQYEQ